MSVELSHQSQSITDFTAYEKMRSLARKDQQAALPQVAKQFEAIFVQSMLKSMRQANTFLSENNPLNSNDVIFFRDMLDQQMAVDLANHKGIGLAEIMIRQMEKNTPQSRGSDTLKTKIDETKSTKAIGSGKTLPEASLEKSTNAIASTTTKNTFSSKSDFISTLWPYAKMVGDKLGLDPKMLVAQAILETGWGKSIIKDSDGQSTHNVFNIKASRAVGGEKVSKQTIEFISGVAKKVIEPFKKYANYLEGFTDYMQLLTSHDRYGKAMENTHNAKQYIRELQQAGYATDPHYAKKIITIYEGAELNQTIDKLEVE